MQTLELSQFDKVDEFSYNCPGSQFYHYAV